MEEYSIQALLNAPLHQFRPEDRSEWYPRVAELVDQDDAAVRDAAVERLAMGTFWAELSSRGTDTSHLPEAIDFQNWSIMHGPDLVHALAQPCPPVPLI